VGRSSGAAAAAAGSSDGGAGGSSDHVVSLREQVIKLEKKVEMFKGVLKKDT
jgi:hypothetical protein